MEKYKFQLRILSTIVFAILAFVRWNNYIETKSRPQLLLGFIWTVALVLGIISLIRQVNERSKKNN